MGVIVYGRHPRTFKLLIELIFGGVILMKSVILKVSEHPAALRTIRVIVYNAAWLKVCEGFAAVEELPLPKFHKYEVAPTEVLVKFTVCGVVHPCTLLAVKPACGFAKTRIDFVIESKHEPKSFTNFTLYKPAAVYTFTGLIVLEKVPSPNVHDAPTFAGIDVLVKFALAPTHTVSGRVKFA